MPTKLLEVRRATSAPVLGVDKATRSVTSYWTTTDVDRYGTIFLPESFRADLPDYQRNPIFCWMHNVWDAPLGSASELKIVKDGCTGRMTFAEAPADSDEEQIWRLYSGGHLRAFSHRSSIAEMVTRNSPKDTIAALPKFARDALKEGTCWAVFTRARLMEISGVTLPGNQAACAPEPAEDDGEDQQQLALVQRALVERVGPDARVMCLEEQVEALARQLELITGRRRRKPATIDALTTDQVRELKEFACAALRKA